MNALFLVISFILVIASGIGNQFHQDTKMAQGIEVVFASGGAAAIENK